MRLDVFQAKVAAEKNLKESGKWEKLGPEDQRLVEKLVRICWSPVTNLLLTVNLGPGRN